MPSPYIGSNGYHTIHHLYPIMHWSLYPEHHRKLVIPRMDPRLDEPSLPAYAWRTFVSPGVRCRYDGAPIAELDAPEPDDADWITYPAECPKQTVEEAIRPLRLAQSILGFVTLLPFKALSPLWSPAGSTI